MKLLVGLGNPGPRYEATRHNAGFLMLNYLAEEAGIRWEGVSSKFNGDIGRGQIERESCFLLKPMTFMNLSGRSVGAAMRYLKIESKELIVFYDDVDVPAGKVKARVGGGHGGHNGVRSIMEETGIRDFHRIKLGVGRPPEQWDTADWVLAPMSEHEVSVLKDGMLKDVKVRLKQIFDGS